MSQLILFENKKVRRLWHNERWYFSIVDICEILTDSPEPRKYWSVLKTRLKKEESELTTICSQLKMQAADGKFYNTDCADAEGLLRIAGDARKNLEKQTGKKVSVKDNYKGLTEGKKRKKNIVASKDKE